MPNRSIAIPKPEDQKVSWNGMVIFPFADSSLNKRSASARVAALTETQNPCGAW